MLVLRVLFECIWFLLVLCLKLLTNNKVLSRSSFIVVLEMSKKDVGRKVTATFVVNVGYMYSY